MRAPENEPALVLREARRTERLPGYPLILRLGVHAGERGTRAHAAEQPDARTAAAGADLDRGLGPDRAGQEAQGSADRREDGLGTAEVGRVGPRGEQRLVLGQVLCGVRKWPHPQQPSAFTCRWGNSSAAKAVTYCETCRGRVGLSRPADTTGVTEESTARW